MLSLFSLVIPLFTGNIHLAPLRLAFDQENQDSQISLFKTSAATALGLTGIGLLLFSVSSYYGGIAEEVFQYSPSIILLFGSIILFLTLIQSIQTLLRIERRAKETLVLLNIQSYTVLGSYLILNRYFTDEFKTLVVCYTVGTFFSALFGIFKAKGYLRTTGFDPTLIRRCFAYAAPTALQAVIIWVLNSGGRWIGAHFLPLSDLTPYLLVLHVLSIITIFNSALFDARIPDIARYFSQNNYEVGRQIVRKTALLSTVFLCFAFTVIYAALYVFNLRLPIGYMPPASFIGIAFLTSLFDVLYGSSSRILQNMKATGYSAIGTAIGAIISLVSSFWLIQAYGVSGLLLGLLLGTVTQALTTSLFARRILARAVQAQRN